MLSYKSILLSWKLFWNSSEVSNKHEHFFCLLFQHLGAWHRAAQRLPRMPRYRHHLQRGEEEPAPPAAPPALASRGWAVLRWQSLVCMTMAIRALFFPTHLIINLFYKVKNEIKNKYEITLLLLLLHNRDLQNNIRPDHPMDSNSELSVCKTFYSIITADRRTHFWVRCLFFRSA